MDLPVPVDDRIKIKEIEKIIDIARELKKTVKHERGGTVVIVVVGELETVPNCLEKKTGVIESRQSRL